MPFVPAKVEDDTDDSYDNNSRHDDLVKIYQSGSLRIKYEEKA